MSVQSRPKTRFLPLEKPLLPGLEAYTKHIQTRNWRVHLWLFSVESHCLSVVCTLALSKFSQVCTSGYEPRSMLRHRFLIVAQAGSRRKRCASCRSVCDTKARSEKLTEENGKAFHFGEQSSAKSKKAFNFHSDAYILI